ncbi:hypothetical protein Pa4123_02280 [Phytohabitans aurantiacus]|uniref:Uncharacterized protein n=1 Tax=Phytohabitans aurantiacus TaxID=3016789 RepID=A0ABQ5QN48_9ACTN|nr:hypothetical protein Pa4123_02280 [Phytohabitans aurantiacus]
MHGHVDERQHDAEHRRPAQRRERQRRGNPPCEECERRGGHGLHEAGRRSDPLPAPRATPGGWQGAPCGRKQGRAALRAVTSPAFFTGYREVEDLRTQEWAEGRTSQQGHHDEHPVRIDRHPLSSRYVP